MGVTGRSFLVSPVGAVSMDRWGHRQPEVDGGVIGGGAGQGGHMVKPTWAGKGGGS